MKFLEQFHFPGLSRSALCQAGLAFALVLACAGHPVQAMDQPASIRDAGEKRRPMVLGFASFMKGQLYELKAGQPCATCRTAAEKAGCSHAVPSLLLNFRQSAASGNMGSDGSYNISPEFDRMVPGPDGTLIMSSVDGELWKYILDLKQDDWTLISADAYLSRQQCLELGLPSVPFQDFAVGSDGAIVLAYGRNVAWLPRAGGKCAKEEVKWLVGGPPPAAETRHDDAAAVPPERTPGALLAVDADGVVFVARPAVKAVFGFNPRTGEKKMAGWPMGGLQPVSMVAQGRHLHLAMTQAGDAQGFTLISLIHQGEDKPFKVQTEVYTDVRLDGALGVSKDGRLLAYDAAHAKIITLENDGSSAGGTPVETKSERKGAGKSEEVVAQARAADAAYAALLAEVEAERKDERKREKRKRARKAAAVRRMGETEGGRGERMEVRAGVADGRSTADPFGTWCQRQHAATPKDQVGFVAWLGQADPSAGTHLEPPKVMPKGWGRFALSEAALGRAVQWMLGNAHLANRMVKGEGWRAQLMGDQPRVLFSRRQTPDRSGVVLELSDVRPFAGAMDAAADGSLLVVRELDRSEDLTGFGRDAQGKPRFAYGLTLTLAADGQTLVDLDPGGDQATGLTWGSTSEEKN